MAGITLEQAQAQLDAALTAAADLKAHKQVEFNGRRLTFQDLDQVNRDIAFWDDKVKALAVVAASGSRARTIRPGW
jgi:hypothetical protein